MEKLPDLKQLSSEAKEALEVLGEHHPDIWVSDLFSAQKNRPASQWQVCLDHQLRDCQYAIDARDRIFSPTMNRLLLRAFIIHRRRSKIDYGRLNCLVFNILKDTKHTSALALPIALALAIALHLPIALARQAGCDRICVHTTYSVSA